MKCPNCSAELALAKRDGVEMEVCPACNGMWLSQQELTELEDEAYDLGKKGTLVFDPEPSSRRCPACDQGLKRFHYRDYDLELEFCETGHGFFLDAGEDKRVLELMRKEEANLKRAFGAEDHWSAHMRHWRSGSFMDRLKNLLG
ncbi:MAG TPA: zf-TFIIB domain-containing protein [Caulobacteraceae bacterium]|nr:zf-TFIIB domain-containing protein [Caulobacteraceae bacterium]